MLATLFTILTAAIFYPVKDIIGYQVVSFGLLITVSILSLFVGIGPILVSATLSALIWNFFFIPPRFSFYVDRIEDILMLTMYFIIAMVGGIMTSRVRNQERLTRDRELRTNALYQLTRELFVTSGINNIIDISVKYIDKYSKLESKFLLQDGKNSLNKLVKPNNNHDLPDPEFSIAEWTFQHSRKAGRFTDTLPSALYTYYPLIGNKMRIGVVLIRHTKQLKGDEELFWDAFRTQISNALEREYLNDIARRASVLDESDKLYQSLFNSISHELKIPVATILGASDTLLSGDYDKNTNRCLYEEINKASARLNRLIENLLNISRLESGRISIRPDWHDVRDLANKVTDDLRDVLENFRLEVNIPDDMPLVKIDFGLIEQVLHNLVLNSAQYSNHGTTIRIKMFYDHPDLIIQVMDRGPGFPPGELENVFNKFYRLEANYSGGTGLGLSIVKGFIQAHNGTVSIENRKNGGSRITVKIPTETTEINKII